MRLLPYPVLFIFIIPLFIVSASFSFEGPLQVRNMYPLFIHADEPYLEKAAMENSISFSLSHSTTHTADYSNNWIINADMEITDLNFRYKRILKDIVEFDIDVPVLLIGAGVLDGILADYHDSFGFDDYGRSRRPQNEFLYEVRKDGALIVKGKSGIRVGDVRISLKKPLVSGEKYTFSIKGDIEIPLGNGKQGFSNGSLDGAVAILLDAAITDNIATYWNVGAIFPGDLRGHKKLNLRNYFYGGVSLEAIVSNNVNLLIQFVGQSDIYPHTDVLAVDREGYMIAFGGRYISGDRSLELSLTEDLHETAAPDLIINLTYKKRI